MNHIGGETATRQPQSVLSEFRALIPRGGRVLVAGCGEGRELAQLAHAGFSVEGFDVASAMTESAAKFAPTAKVWTADVRLLSVAKESYDGIYAPRLFRALDPPGCQRALAVFFAALKPNGSSANGATSSGGALFAAVELPTDSATEGARFRYGRDDFASLLRQNGFRVLAEGSPVGSPGEVGFLARRI